MSILELDMIDYIYVKSQSSIELRVYDIYFWDDNYSHIGALYDKINSYIDYIESDEFKSYPNAYGKTPVIHVFFAFKPSNEIIEFIENDVCEVLKGFDIPFKYTYSVDLSYSCHFDFSKEHGIMKTGDSGSLYLARGNYNENEKYLVKHEYKDCACNEYIYSKIANLLEIKVPQVKLFILTSKQDTKFFKTKYIVGMTWLDIVDDSICENDLNKYNIANQDDYYRFKALSALLKAEDGFEVALSKDGYIYKVDNTASFCINDCVIPPQVLSQEVDFLKSSSYAKRLKHDELSMQYNSFVEKFGNNKAHFFIDTVSKFSKLEDNCLDHELKVLANFYSDDFTNFYIQYVKWMRQKAKDFLNTLSIR